MKLSEQFKIGQLIRHGKCYAMKCTDRFGEKDFSGKEKRDENPTPIALTGEGFIVGIKRAIMSEYKFTAGYNSQGFEEPYPEHVNAYATGKFEECLIVTKSIKPFKTYLVRIIDIL